MFLTVCICWLTYDSTYLFIFDYNTKIILILYIYIYYVLSCDAWWRSGFLGVIIHICMLLCIYNIYICTAPTGCMFMYVCVCVCVWRYVLSIAPYIVSIKPIYYIYICIYNICSLTISLNKYIIALFIWAFFIV